MVLIFIFRGSQNVLLLFGIFNNLSSVLSGQPSIMERGVLVDSANKVKYMQMKIMTTKTKTTKTRRVLVDSANTKLSICR
jgi:hypothetical protein